MNELLLIKFFLDKDIYTHYRHLVGNELVQGDALILLTLLDDWFISNDKPISLDDLYFLALTRFTREQGDLLFQSLRGLS